MSASPAVGAKRYEPPEALDGPAAKRQLLTFVHLLAATAPSKLPLPPEPLSPAEEVTKLFDRVYKGDAAVKRRARFQTERIRTEGDVIEKVEQASLVLPIHPCAFNMRDWIARYRPVAACIAGLMMRNGLLDWIGKPVAFWRTTTAETPFIHVCRREPLLALGMLDAAPGSDISGWASLGSVISVVSRSGADATFRSVLLESVLERSSDAAMNGVSVPQRPLVEHPFVAAAVASAWGMDNPDTMRLLQRHIHADGSGIVLTDELAETAARAIDPTEVGVVSRDPLLKSLRTQSAAHIRELAARFAAYRSGVSPALKEALDSSIAVPALLQIIDTYAIRHIPPAAAPAPAAAAVAAAAADSAAVSESES